MSVVMQQFPKDSGNDQILGDDISSFDAMELPFVNL
jgi:hypothetical protein